jgi:hypothetical protein
MDNTYVSPIDISLEPAESSEDADKVADRIEYAFRGEGAYLPFSGRWMIEVRVMDQRDNETVYQKEDVLY